MTEIIIFLEDIDPVVFFGTNNSLLDKIRSFFPKIKIMARITPILIRRIFFWRSSSIILLFFQTVNINIV